MKIYIGLWLYMKQKQLLYKGRVGFPCNGFQYRIGAGLQSTKKWGGLFAHKNHLFALVQTYQTHCRTAAAPKHPRTIVVNSFSKGCIIGLGLFLYSYSKINEQTGHLPRGEYHRLWTFETSGELAGNLYDEPRYEIPHIKGGSPVVDCNRLMMMYEHV